MFSISIQDEKKPKAEMPLPERRVSPTNPRWPVAPSEEFSSYP
jgi:hypothetical protein